MLIPSARMTGLAWDGNPPAHLSSQQCPEGPLQMGLIYVYQQGLFDACSGRIAIVHVMQHIWPAVVSVHISQGFLIQCDECLTQG